MTIQELKRAFEHLSDGDQIAFIDSIKDDLHVFDESSHCLSEVSEVVRNGNIGLYVAKDKKLRKALKKGGWFEGTNVK